MKPILIAAALITLVGAAAGAASRGHAPARPMHDELRWSENSAAWTQQPRHGANA